MPDVVPHIFEDHLVRSILHGGEPWFVGKDVCAVLDIKNESQALARLDDDERAGYVLYTQFGEKETIIVSVPGVFRLIFTSRKPEAERFKRWLAHEVLPTLLKQGRYTMPGANLTGNDGQPYPPEHFALPLARTRAELVSLVLRMKGAAAAYRLWEELGLPKLPPTPAEREDGEARDCLAHILLAQVPGLGNRVGELVTHALDEDAAGFEPLKQAGIWVEPGEDGVVFANRHPALEKVLAGTPWANAGWAKVLRRLPGATASRPRRWGNVTVRGTFVPAGLVG